MKVDTINRDIQRSASFEERAMGLAAGSEAFVFNVLRKDLYSDPIGSLIREYAVNAQDEHRKHNKTDVPIFIQVPNQFSPELHIRDYAGGLTEEQVFNFFGNYGASDKRDSNVAVGFFGLGCKSAFAYTDSYIVKSFKDGMEYTFNVYIDETEIGRVAKISESETSEPNGILIIVPVKSWDINEFQRKVISTVRYFKTKPVIGGLAEAPVFDNKTSAIKGDDWEFFGSGSPTIVMGEIPYPLDYYKMGDIENWESNLIRSEIVIYVNIGDVQVTASREALQMSPQTIQTIRGKLKGIKDAMIAETEKAFAEAKNIVEAKQLYNSVVQNGGGYSRIIQSCGKDLTWNGEVIDDNVIRFGDNSPHRVTTYFLRRGKIKTEVGSRLVCKKGDTVYFDDTNQVKVGYMRRARTILDNNFTNGIDRIQIIHTTDVADLESKLGMKTTDFLSYNAVTPTIAQSNRAGGTGVDLTKRAKHTSKVFVLNVDKLRGYYSAASEVWDVKEIDQLEGVYIPINRFKPMDLNGVYCLDTLRTMIASLESAGIDIDIPIYGIKLGAETGNLVKFDTWVDTKISENTELIRKYALVRGYSESNLHDVSNLKVDALPPSLAKSYATKYSEIKKLYNESRTNNFAKVFRYSSIEVKPNTKIAQLSKAFEAKYPMLNLVSSYQYSSPEVVNYIMEKENRA